jgi:murein L,D-transpeptidase YcbB/YkuD
MHDIAHRYARLANALCLLGCLLGWPIATHAAVPDDVLSRSLHAQIARPDSVTQALTMDWTYLERFYSLRQYLPVWTDMRGPNRRASILRQFLHVADQEGLTPATFHLSAIESSWHRRTPSELATLDILLSDAFFRYASDVRMGRLSPLDVDPQWHLASPDIHPVSLLQKMLTSADFEAAMRALPPQQHGYQRLREALAHYRQLAAQGGWPLIPAGPTLREGMRHPQVVALRKRLIAEGDMQDTRVTDARLFDPAVKFGVDRFQVRHGLKMDGVVGPATRNAMNVSVADRITQIKLNMERWRWLPRKLGERYLIVNTAGYDLTAFANGHATFSMWVVIGKQDRQTPEIAGLMHTVVFNPYWTVPTTIAIEDLIPAQRRNPNYLRTRKIRVFANLSKHIEADPRKIDWEKYTKDNFPYVLRQDPGPYNPLGHFKFLFSNEFDVYLHDTPARQLFAQKQRTFSSGCIRVENPLQLATFLLALNPGWDEPRILAAADSAQTSEVKLAKSLPIYLVYLTAWVGPDETVHFYPDVYARDKPIAACVSPGRHYSGGEETLCMP